MGAKNTDKNPKDRGSDADLARHIPNPGCQRGPSCPVVTAGARGAGTGKVVTAWSGLHLHLNGMHTHGIYTSHASAPGSVQAGVGTVGAQPRARWAGKVTPMGAGQVLAASAAVLGPQPRIRP